MNCRDDPLRVNWAQKEEGRLAEPRSRIADEAVLTHIWVEYLI